MDYFSEISLELFLENQDYVNDSYITQVYDYHNNKKFYIFYTYCITYGDSHNKDILLRFLKDYKENGMDASEIHESPLMILLGKHETLRLCKPGTGPID